MKDKVKVKIKCDNKSKLLLKLNNINVLVESINYSRDYIIFVTYVSDIKKIKKYLLSYKLELVEELGINKIKKELKRNSLFLTSIIFAVIIFLFLTNIIIKVNVIHEDAKLRNLLNDALKERGVASLSFKKNYEDYENIISEIKNEFKDKIEWLEIEVDGMVINVRVEERIINDYSKEYNTCHIVAAKSGVISGIVTTKGVQEVRINDYVNKNDILINGQIKLNEDVKKNVCAQGEVYAEVWYNASITLPMTYIEEEKTSKIRYNFKVNDLILLKSRVNEKIVKEKKLFSIFGLNFYLQKEIEINKKTKTYTMEEATRKAQELILEKLEIKLDNQEIINQKVLKKSLNNGNLYIDMFIAIKEQIGVKQYFTVEMDSGTNDESNNGNT